MPRLDCPSVSAETLNPKPLPAMREGKKTRHHCASRPASGFKDREEQNHCARITRLRTQPVDPKTYRFKGSTLQLRDHNLLFCRVWGYRKNQLLGSPSVSFETHSSKDSKVLFRV